MIPPPTKEDLAAAFEAGVPLRCGLPVVAHAANVTHVLNLVAARRGDPQPWVSVRDHGNGYTELSSANGHASYIAGRRLNGTDAVHAAAAFRAAPKDSERHTPAGHEARIAAGLQAMQIRDAHCRAHVLSAVDGWEAIGGDLVDSDPRHGELRKSAVVPLAHLLLVVCPSTGRRYAHLVPQECKTAKAARHWMMGRGENDPTPSVET